MNNKQGFTLIELMLFMVMFSTILIVLSSLFSAIVEKQLETEAISAMESDSKFLLARLVYDISQADSITTPAVLGAQSSDLSLVISGVTHTYSLSDGNLQLIRGTETDNLNGVRSTVSDLSFIRLGNPSGKHAIRVAFTVTSNTVIPNGPETKTINSVVGLR